MPKWQRGNNKEKDEEKDMLVESRALAPEISDPTKSITNNVKDSMEQDEHAFVRSLLVQHRIALQQVLADNSERILEVMMQEMTSLQTKISERQGEFRAQQKKVDDLPPPQLIGSPLEGQKEICGKQVRMLAEQDDSDQMKKTGTANNETKMPHSMFHVKSIRQFAPGLAHRITAKFHTKQHDEAGQRGVFADAEAMKADLRRDMAKPVYDVMNFYKTTVWIAVDVDYNDATVLVDASWYFIIVDNVFCAYFFVEWAIRFGAFAKKRDCLRDVWFLFDSLLCGLNTLETWVMSLFVLIFSVKVADASRDAGILTGFRLFRLVRMLRVMRLCHELPELMVVCKGMAVATRAVSCTVTLMIIVMYVFAVLFRSITDGTSLGKKHFPSVPLTMRFLMLNGAVPDLEDRAVEIWNEGILYAILFGCFILVITITIMNMLVGVLVGVMNTVAKVEKEQLTVNFVKQNLLTILRNLESNDSDNNGLISKEEFGELLKNADAVRAFDMMGVDVVGLVDLADYIFAGGKQLTFQHFMEVIMQLRGDNQATVKDIVDLRKFITLELKSHMKDGGMSLTGKPMITNASADMRPVRPPWETGGAQPDSVSIAPSAPSASSADSSKEEKEDDVLGDQSARVKKEKKKVNRPKSTSIKQ